MEPVLDPAQAIIDAHHHLYDRPGVRYLMREMLDDARAGHDIRATVFVQARSMYRNSGPEPLRAVGETEFAAAVADTCARAVPRQALLCAAIVGHADLTLGDAVGAVLEAHIEAGAGRFKGIRMPLAWDRDASLLNPAYPTHAATMEDDAFLRGFARLGEFGLSFDAWLFFHQIPQFISLARRFPDTPMVLNHCGGVLGVGRYRDIPGEVRRQWQDAIWDLAACQNVMVKLGGLGLPLTGIGQATGARRPGSAELAAAWKPWIEPCIEAFGPSRCMFESNFPADKASYDYVAGWNAMKRIVRSASQADKDALFWKTAARFYRIGQAAGNAC